MAKVKSAFFCQSCGYESPKWLGKCPSCNTWNTFVEEVVDKGEKQTWKEDTRKVSNKPTLLSKIEAESFPRINTQDQELNRVLGGGIVAGSLVLIGGEPGIGKSTLMLQVALSLKEKKVLYVSGEESDAQIKMRADRIDIKTENCYILPETHTQKIFKEVENLVPDVLIIDSIQTLYSSVIESATGSISQIRQCAGELMKFAKETATPVILIGHITKDGSLAGPKILEHMVDTVLLFEGDRHMTYRILRTVKNRFGSTSELGIYEMTGEGLKEVLNPSEILLSQREEELSGISTAVTQEGNRALLVEIQALVSNAAYGTPQRSCTGYDLKRLNMLLAVLEKRGGFRLGVQDVFLNIAGGLKIDDPATDLAICSSIISSLEEISISPTICFAAEVGLGGEIRAVNRVESRVSEAEKLGFKEIIISKYNKLDVSKYNIKVTVIARIEDLISYLFG